VPHSLPPLSPRGHCLCHILFLSLARGDTVCATFLPLFLARGDTVCATFLTVLRLLEEPFVVKTDNKVTMWYIQCRTGGTYPCRTYGTGHVPVSDIRYQACTRVGREECGTNSLPEPLGKRRDCGTNSLPGPYVLGRMWLKQPPRTLYLRENVAQTASQGPMS